MDGAAMSLGLHGCGIHAVTTRRDQVVAGEIVIDAEPVPLAEVGKTWAQPDDGRRVVFVP